MVLANGRLSERRMGRYRRWSSLYAPLLTRLTCIGASSSEDAERFLEIGARRDRIEVTGNLKYDLPSPGSDRAAIRRYSLPNRLSTTAEELQWRPSDLSVWDAWVGR